MSAGQAELVGELVLGVGDVGLDRAAVEGALADDVHVLAALADVDGDGDDLGAGLSAIQPMATEVSRPPE